MKAIIVTLAALTVVGIVHTIAPALLVGAVVVNSVAIPIVWIALPVIAGCFYKLA